MTKTTRTKKLLVSVLAGVGITAGAAGIANAVSTPRAPVTTQAAAAETPDANEAPGAAETPDANEAAEAPGKEDSNEPSYTSSVTAPQAAGNETDENAALAPLAKISAADATKAALAAVPGTASPAVLENENGNVVYAVTIVNGTTTTDVKVDAGNGKVLAQDNEAED